MLALLIIINNNSNNNNNNDYYYYYFCYYYYYYYYLGVNINTSQVFKEKVFITRLFAHSHETDIDMKK